MSLDTAYAGLSPENVRPFETQRLYITDLPFVLAHKDLPSEELLERHSALLDRYYDDDRDDWLCALR